MPSIVPPSISAVVIVPRSDTVAPEKFTVPDAVRFVTVAAAADAPPIVTPSKVPPSMSAVVTVPRLLTVPPVKFIVPEAVKSVTVAAAAVDAPIIVPSMLPPLMSKLLPSISTEPASSFLPRVIF